MARKTPFSMKHSWKQKLLIMIGFKVCNICYVQTVIRDIWLNPLNCNEQTFHKMFIQRLDDQYRQNLLGFIKTSSRFQVLSSLKNGVELSPYITQIRNPYIRQIFTRLRIDLNCLVTCKTKETLIQRDTCPFCHIDGESVEHFLLVCTHFDKLHIDFENSIRNVLYSYDNLSLNSKLKYNYTFSTSIAPWRQYRVVVNLYRIYISQEKDCNRANPDILLSPIFDL